MPTQNPSFIAGETLYPSRFVTQDATDDLTVNMSDASDAAVGITYEGSRVAPIPEVTTPEAAIAGESVRIHGMGEECWLEAGATITPGQLLEPDADAKGTPASAGETYSARALSGAAAGERCRVFVERGTVGT